MHMEPLAPPASSVADGKPWYKSLTRYHWFVLMVAALGWLFDCLDQQLFILARPAAMKELVVQQETPQLTDQARRHGGDIVTAIFIAGWACGGLIFGVLGDRIGRAKTMILTILLYSLFTGLSALSRSVYDFALYRFLTGLGVGGEFAVGVALVAEVMPSRARPYALALLQALSAIGNVSAAFINLGLGIAAEQGLVQSPWRIMFLVGALPALLALIVRAKLREPDKWQKASHDGVTKEKLGSYRELFSDPVLRKHAILGLLLGSSGIIGLWSIVFFTPDLIREVRHKPVSEAVYTEKLEEANRNGALAQAQQWSELRDHLTRGSAVPEPLRHLQADADPIINGRLSRWQSYTSLMINVGAFFGMFGFGALAQRIGRKPTFAIAFLAAFCSTVSVYWFLAEFWQIFVMVPIMGFCQLSLFAGYAIYFPELFPTRLRSTGTSFCYNVGRFLAVPSPLVKSALEGAFSNTSAPFRYAGITMCLVFLIGLFVLPFLPETKGEPLPE